MTPFDIRYLLKQPQILLQHLQGSGTSSLRILRDDHNFDYRLVCLVGGLRIALWPGSNMLINVIMKVNF